MPEAGSNVELARDLTTHGEALAAGTPHGKWLGFVEAFVLAIVAVSTAFSGYQASRWDGNSARSYALYEHYAVLSQAKATLAGQDRLYDIVTFNGWVAAKTAGQEKLATFYERRFRPEYAVAYRAWKALDPFHNSKAPPGAIFMSQYRSAHAAEAARLDAISARSFDDGVSARERSDDYVRITVFLATALFLTALSQRFEYIGPRIVIVAIAAVLLIISLSWIATLPRA